MYTLYCTSDTFCEEISLIKLDKYPRSQADIQVKVDLLIYAPTYTIESSLLYGIVLTIQTTRYNYLIKSKHDN